MRINQAHVKCCLLSNQTIVFLVSFLSLLLETKEEFGKAIEKKTRDAGFSKSRMESDNLEEPLVFNYTIASSYHLGDLFLYFFFFFFTENVL